MIDVTEATKTAFKLDGVHKEIVANIGVYSYTNSDIVDGSLSISQSIFDGDNLDVCGCVASKLEIKIWVPKMGEGQGYPLIPVRGEPVNVKVKAGNTEWINVFGGRLNDIDAVATNDFITYVAYDKFYMLSGRGDTASDTTTQYDVTNWFNEHNETNIGTLLTQLCSKFGIQISSHVPPLDCHDVMTKCGKEHKVSSLSALDLLKDIFRVNGCFGYFDGEGKLSWRYLETSPYDTDGTLYPSGYLYPSSDLYPGNDPSQAAQNNSHFVSEYETFNYKTYRMEPVSRVEVADYENDRNKGTAGTSIPNKYKMYGNVCLLGASKAIKDRVASSLLNRLRSIFYIPYEVKCLGLPFFEVGDSIVLYDARKEKYFQTFILNRTMSISQHMTDSFSATGNQYLSEFVVGSERDTSTSEDTQQQIDDLNGRVDGVDEDILNINTDLDNINTDVNTLQTDYTNLNSDYGNFKNYVNDYIDSGGGGATANILTVKDLPSNPRANTIYLIRGDVVVI